MENIQLVHNLNQILNCLFVACMGGFVRACFTKGGSFREVAVNFLGSTVFGVLIGYLIFDVNAIIKWQSLFVAAFSVFSKEFFDALKIALPNWVIDKWNKLTKK